LTSGFLYVNYVSDTWVILLFEFTL